jgi:hypothetical protein
MARNKAPIPLWVTPTTVNTTATITSSPIGQRISMGYCALIVELAGSAPSVNITIECALTETSSWYTPYDNLGTSLGTVYTGLTTSRWIEFSPPLAPYVRFNITGDGANGADTTVVATFMFEEEFR